MASRARDRFRDNRMPIAMRQASTIEILDDGSQVLEGVIWTHHHLITLWKATKAEEKLYEENS